LLFGSRNSPPGARLKPAYGPEAAFPSSEARFYGFALDLALEGKVPDLKF
jgi:hypothetical protein